MAHGRPWYKRAGGDFVMATLSMPDAETKWAYSAIIDMLNERDRPLADDPGFICGFTGLSKRRWSVVRKWLLDHGYIETTGEDGLTNARFERERIDREKARQEAVEQGRIGGTKSAQMRAAGQSELPLGDEESAAPSARARTEQPPNSNLSREKVPQESKIKSTFSEDKSEPAANRSNNSNHLAQPPPQAPCARERLEAREEKKESTPNPSTSETREGRLGNPDLKDLFDACCDAAGLHLVDPGAIDRAMAQVERWRDSGIDFDTVVLPTIRAVTLKSDEPSRLLSRFTREIQHQHAKSKAAAQKDQPYEPPEIPLLEPNGEDETLRPLRAALLDRHGPKFYCMAFNLIRFENPGQCQGDKRPLIVKGPDYRIESLRHGRQRDTLLNVARDFGFTDIW